MSNLKSSICGFFGWLAFLCFSILLIFSYLFSYVGVYIQYVCGGLGVISFFIWWKLNPEFK